MKTDTKISAIAAACFEKKADDIVVIDLRKMSTLGEYYVLASGASTPQVRAISDSVIESLIKLGIRPRHVEGVTSKPTWILMDYGDVVVHIFHEEQRRFYSLERLWGDAPQRRFKYRKGATLYDVKIKPKKRTKPSKKKRVPAVRTKRSRRAS